MSTQTLTPCFSLAGVGFIDAWNMLDKFNG
jgi:hypothetical protein